MFVSASVSNPTRRQIDSLSWNWVCVLCGGGNDDVVVNTMQCLQFFQSYSVKPLIEKSVTPAAWRRQAQPTSVFDSLLLHFFSLINYCMMNADFQYLVCAAQFPTRCNKAKAVVYALLLLASSYIILLTSKTNKLAGAVYMFSSWIP